MHGGAPSRPTALAALCAATVLVAFLPSVSFPFLLWWDDGYGVFNNRHLTFDFSGLWWMFTNLDYSHWQPLTWLSLAADRAIWGPGPFGHHVTNILLHALNTVLLFQLARMVMKPVSADSDVDTAAALVSLLWALHPLRVEPVTWISERRTLLATMFAVGAALAYGRGAKEDDSRGGDWRGLALILGMAAMASKVSAIALPGALLVLDARLRGGLRWREKIVWLVPMSTSLACNVVAQTHRNAVSWEEFGIIPRMMQAAFGIVFHPLKTLLPSGLSPHYQYVFIVEPVPFIGAVVGVLASAAAVWRLRHRFPGLAQGVIAYLVLIFPLLGFFKTGRITVADRYAYLATIPLFFAAGGLYLRLPRTRLVPLGGMIAVLIAAGFSRRYMAVWSSEVAMWERACEQFPRSFFPRFKLAQAEESAGLTDAAIADAALAKEIHQEFFIRMATAFDRHGNAARAESARVRSRGPFDSSRFPE